MLIVVLIVVFRTLKARAFITGKVNYGFIWCRFSVVSTVFNHHFFIVCFICISIKTFRKTLLSNGSLAVVPFRNLSCSVFLLERILEVHVNHLNIA